MEIAGLSPSMASTSGLARVADRERRTSCFDLRNLLELGQQESSKSLVLARQHDDRRVGWFETVRFNADGITYLGQPQES